MDDDVGLLLEADDLGPAFFEEEILVALLRRRRHRRRGRA